MARFDRAVWRGPVPNKTERGMQRPILGLVLHIEQGSEHGTDAWFHNAKAQASSHFGNPKQGPLDQWVDTNDRAWAQAQGNARWISVEHEGLTGERLTDSQVENDAQLLVWLHKTEGVPLKLTNVTNVGGLGWHGMGGESWGGHTNCPGAPIVAQRADILARANQILGGSPPANLQEASNMLDDGLENPAVAVVMTPSGNGYLIVQSNGGVHARGDAMFHGSLGSTVLNAHIVDAVIVDDGAGYMLLGADGGLFHFGSAARLVDAGNAVGEIH